MIMHLINSGKIVINKIILITESANLIRSHLYQRLLEGKFVAIQIRKN